MATIAEALANAMTLHQSGQLDAAEQIYSQILQSNPQQIDALHLSGLIAHQRGQHETAVELIRRAVKFNPNVADLQTNLGLVCFSARQLPDAITSYRRSLQLQPNDPRVWMMLGVALKDQGEFRDAVTSLRKAIQLKPDFVEAHGNLGNVYREQGQLDDAIACYRKLLSLNPRVPEAYANLATALQEQGHLDEAIANYQRAIELRPTYAEAYGNLGNALKACGQLDEAVQHFRRAVELKPELVEAIGNLGIALMDQGYPEQAIECYRRALQLRPRDAVTLNNLGNVLTNRGRLSEAIDCFQRALAINPQDATAWNNLGTAQKDQGLLDEALSSLRRSLSLRPDNAMAHSNLLMTLQYCDGMTPEILAREHAVFNERHVISRQKSVRPVGRASARPQRWGFVSADFGRHPIGYFLIRTLEHLDPQAVQVICYSDRTVKDEYTRRFQAVSSEWRDTFGQSDACVAEQIRADGVDLLFDLGGHTGHNRILLFASQPAPRSITWIGYEGTTGLSTIDSLLADRWVTPAGLDEHTRETIIRLPDGYLCYDPPAEAPSVASPPSVKNGYPTFGSFNNLAKITPRVIEVWSQVLSRLPQARLLMSYQGLGDPVVQQRYRSAFASHGIDPTRITLRPPAKFADYLASYSEVDAILDPFPFSGSTTTCEALWMGVPVVTCPQHTFASRHSYSHLSNIGLTDSIVHDLHDYISRAVELASDVSRLVTIRASLRERMRQSPLCDGSRFAANLTDTLLALPTH